MEEQNFKYQEPVEIQSVSSEVMSKTFMAKVFSWMSLGLIVTGLLSYLFGTVPNLMDMLTSSVQAIGSDGNMHTHLVNKPLAYVAMLAPFGLIMLMGFGAKRLSYPAMIGVFVLFSAILGISLSTIFLIYTSTSIFSIFFVTAAMFGAMAFLGYTTSTDLTKLGSILLMLLFGVIIASLVNFFLHSASFQYMISWLCVGIFTGLTAYDVQKIKKIGAEMSGDNATVGKASIFGALSLYLDFINLFLSLLMIFGNRRN
jgi:FtsH-binding integral membrane protein